MINFNSVILFNYSSMVQVFVNFVFPQSVLYVALLDIFSPRVVEMMYLASNESAHFQVKCFIHLGIAALSQQGQDQVLV